MSKELEEDKHANRKFVMVLIPLILLLALVAGPPRGAYTDGILQLTVLDNAAGLYPPLYGLLSRAYQVICFSVFSLEESARQISIVGFACALIATYRGALSMCGARAAWIAAVLFGLAPLALRWSVQVMSDTLFLGFSTAAMFCMVQSWAQLRMDARQKSHTLLAWAVALGALAALTRYQGALLAPLLALVVILFCKRFRTVPWLSIGAGVLWLLVPAWMWYNGFVHQAQFAERTAGSFWSDFFAWWNTFESFVLISPYYFGYPIVAAGIAGLFYIRKIARPWYARPAAVLWGLYAVMLLGLQAKFGSLQYRYMLPLLPMVALLAGVGFRWLETGFVNRSWVPRWAFMLSVIFLAFFSISVLALQRHPFNDQFQAAEFIKENVPVTTPVYSNERYGNFTNLGSVKLSFWSGRPVKPLLSPDQPLEPGAVVVLGNSYGGNEAIGAMLNALSQQYELQPLISEPYQSRIVPLMDDIMVNPMFNQNPMGWVMRYVPQQFATNIYRVMPIGSSAQGGGNGS